MRELLQQALDALKLHLTHHEHGCVYLNPIMYAIEAELTKPEQEPVAKVILTETLGLPTMQWLDLTRQFDFKGGEFLYTSPPRKEWVGLTDEEVNRAADYEDQSYGFVKGVLWAQAKLKDKNNG